MGAVTDIDLPNSVRFATFVAVTEGPCHSADRSVCFTDPRRTDMELDRESVCRVDPDGTLTRIIDAVVRFNTAAPPAEDDSVPAGVYVLTPDGEQIGVIPVPQNVVTNVAFGDTDLRTLCITCGATLYYVRLNVRGYVLARTRGVNMRLQNKVAVVTGGGSGIGRSTAEIFAREGARVLVADIDGARATEVAAAIIAGGGVADAFTADVTSDDDAARITSRAMDRWQHLDVLVNNAACFHHKRVEEATREDWEKVLSVNVIGTSLCSKHAVAAMKGCGGGAIVNVASINGLIAMPNWMTYNASKAAVVEISKSMAMDLAPFDIRVNCVCPGVTATPALARAIEDLDITAEEARQGIMEPRALIKRFGRPEEIANAVLFLASDEASYVTGATLVVDGGFTA